jgi:hypothetical protein
MFHCLFIRMDLSFKTLYGSCPQDAALNIHSYCLFLLEFNLTCQYVSWADLCSCKVGPVIVVATCYILFYHCGWKWVITSK